MILFLREMKLLLSNFASAKSKNYRMKKIFFLLIFVLLLASGSPRIYSMHQKDNSSVYQYLGKQ